MLHSSDFCFTQELTSKRKWNLHPPPNGQVVTFLELIPPAQPHFISSKGLDPRQTFSTVSSLSFYYEYLTNSWFLAPFKVVNQRNFLETCSFPVAFVSVVFIYLHHSLERVACYPVSNVQCLVPGPEGEWFDSHFRAQRPTTLFHSLSPLSFHLGLVPSSPFCYWRRERNQYWLWIGATDSISAPFSTAGGRSDCSLQRKFPIPISWEIRECKPKQVSIHWLWNKNGYILSLFWTTFPTKFHRVADEWGVIP